MNKKILGIITARGKSQEFPRKNVTSFCGKPLLAWTILASKKSKYISKTIVKLSDVSLKTWYGSFSPRIA